MVSGELSDTENCLLAYGGQSVPVEQYFTGCTFNQVEYSNMNPLYPPDDEE